MGEANLRHKFTTIFDQLGIESHWMVDEQWPFPLSDVQLPHLMRWLEDALAKVTKHCRAHKVAVRFQGKNEEILHLSKVCKTPAVSAGDFRECRVSLSVTNGGIGFDASMQLPQSRGVGMQSMRA